MIDHVEITATGGKGGNGAVSFRREKYVPFGGPDGGDGGDGGSVILIGDQHVSTLSSFRSRRIYRAENGAHGKGKGMQGRKGKDLYLRVPVGTVIWSVEEERRQFIGDIVKHDQKLVVARGGMGGKGNKRFSSPTRRAPTIATEGEKGETKSLILDLKLLADVGIVGLPNVGKSTLINAASRAKAKVGEYPFTTLTPSLGVVEYGYESFVLADIPGLVEGAHAGAGLGHQFLRHIERTRILIHMIDGPSENPLSDFHKVNRELSLFSTALGNKPQIIALNKIDIPSVREKLEKTKKMFSEQGYTVYPVSAATGEGVSQLIAKACKMLKEIGPPSRASLEGEFKVFHPRQVA